MKKNVKHILAAVFMCTLMLVCTAVCSSAIEIDDSKLIYGSRIAEKIDYNIVPGVSESYIVTQNDDGTNHVRTYVLEIDMGNPEIGIITSYKNYMNNLSDTPEWGMQAVRDQAVAVEKYYREIEGNEDFEVVAGVNGDFFNMGNGAPTGTLVMNSKYYNVNEDWPYFAILEDGTAIIRERKDPVVDNIAQAIGGPEVILKDGQLTSAAVNSGYGVSHPRTAVGIKADGDIVFVVSDGRQAPASCGQTFTMLAEEMLALGCVDALSLDGGGSATFVSQREGEDVLTLRSSPSDGIERTVSTAVLIYSNTDTNKYENTNKWFADNGSVGYYGADGKPVTGSRTINGYTYNFDSEGNLKSFAFVNTDGTLACNRWADNQYYLGADGLPVKGEYTVNGKKFNFDSETGKLISSELKNIWYQCGDDICYFGSDGKLVTGDVKIGSYTYKFDKDGKLTTFASVKRDGTLVTNTWIGDMYYVGADGLPVTGSQKLGKYTYTFGADGRFIKGALVKEGTYTYYYIGGQKQRNWHLIDGYWHYFDRQTGFGMATKGNCDIVSIDYAKDGMYTISTTDARLLFTMDSKGRLTNGSWLETDNGKVYYWGNHERVVGWQVIDDYLYYFNNDTYAVTGKQSIDGKSYTFDAEGRLVAANTKLEIAGKVYAFKSTGKVEHIYTVSVVAPTCTEKGYTLYSCSCGDSYKDNYTDAVSHNYIKGDTFEPTCTEKGYVAYTCTKCGDVRKDVYSDVIGHFYSKGETVAPTCLVKGYTVYTCICGDSYKSDYVDVTGHNYVKSETVAPTCLIKGYTVYICSDCTFSEKRDYVDETGHNYVKTETVAPTCLIEGYTVYTCSGCTVSEKRDYIDATGHTAGEWEKTSDTLEVRHCTVCGAKLDEREIVIARLQGDANDDGRITAADARLVLRMAAQIDAVPDDALTYLDMNQDKKITAMDARLILRKAAQLD